VYIDGRPRVTLQRAPWNAATRHAFCLGFADEPLESAITTIPYATVAAFMSKPSVLANEQIKAALTSLRARQSCGHFNGDTLYARGFQSPVETGHSLQCGPGGRSVRDPTTTVSWATTAFFTGSGHVTRSGDPATLIMTESSRERCPATNFSPAASTCRWISFPARKVKINGRIMAVSDGVTVIGQYQVVVYQPRRARRPSPGNVLGVFGLGGYVRDTVNQGYLGGMSRLARRTCV